MTLFLGILTLVVFILYRFKHRYNYTLPWENYMTDYLEAIENKIYGIIEKYILLFWIKRNQESHPDTLSIKDGVGWLKVRYNQKEYEFPYPVDMGNSWCIYQEEDGETSRKIINTPPILVPHPSLNKLGFSFSDVLET